MHAGSVAHHCIVLVEYARSYVWSIYLGFEGVEVPNATILEEVAVGCSEAFKVELPVALQKGLMLLSVKCLVSVLLQRAWNWLWRISLSAADWHLFERVIALLFREGLQA